MKKFLLAIAVLAGLSATAQTFAVGDLKYTITSATTVEVSGLANTAATAIDVPATAENEGVTYNVTAIGDQAFRWASITSAIIPSSVEVIKHGAFNGADLVSITLNEGLKEIGDYSLACKNLTAIDVPSTVTRIGDDAFFSATALANVTLHEGLKTIGKSAFYKAPMTSLVIPASVDTIDKTAFLFCKQLATVTLNEGLKYLGDGAFNGCTALQGITLPSTLTHIGMECFLENTQMQSIYLGAGIKELGESFMAKTGITTINLDPANPYFKLVDGVLYSMNGLILYAAPMQGLTEYTVPDGTTAIYGGAFWGSQIVNITLPESMLVLDDYAFCQSPLANINLPNGITYLGEQVFAATNLTEVVLPENAPYIQDGEFAGCTKLRKLTFPSSILQVYNHAFMNCSNLTITALGSNPPEIMDYYDDWDEPFYNASVTVYVPKGAKSAYQAADWSYYVTLKESETGTVKTVATSPAYGDTIVNATGYIPMSVTVTFDQPVELVQENPDVHIRTNYLFYSSDIRPDDQWVASLSDDQKTLTLYGADLDGFTCQFRANEEDWYYFSLPAGMVKNADGEESEHIFILVHYAQGEAPQVPGDANGDGQVDISDVNAVINMMLGKTDMVENCDMNGDGKIDISDVNAVINKMLGK
ncbi:MAG: leucine-rich repeat protein [Muribaculaceae bacterium]|nr:leucine-rich repeat protein [Muribaculaceae bacterium]